MTGETYELVDWVGEDTSSVVQCNRVAGGVFMVGEVSRMWTSGGTFNAVIVTSGEYITN